MTRMESLRPDPTPDVDLGATLKALGAGWRRQRRLILSITALFGLLAVVYVMTATPQYTARAAILLDPRISTNTPMNTDTRDYLLSDALLVDSEINVLTSRELTSRLVERLGLYDQPEAVEKPGLLGTLKQWITGTPQAQNSLENPGIQTSDTATTLPKSAAEASRREEIRREMMKNLDVRRQGETYVIDIGFTADDRLFAVDVVNTLVAVYFDMAAENNRMDNQRVTAWLDQQVRSLADDVASADRAVAEYRDQHDLYTIRDGVLPSQAELSASNDRLIEMRTALIDVQTTNEKIQQVIDTDSVSGLLDGTLGGELATPALKDLQLRYAALQEQLAEGLARMGAKSPTVANIQREQSQVRTLILQEAQQITDRLISRESALKRQIAATEAQVATLREQASTDAKNSIRLRELEREATLKRNLYETMLTELNATAQRLNFERSPARVLANAVPPDQKSSPKSKQTVIMALFAGFVLGAALGFLREVQDNRFRRPRDLRDNLDLPFLGLLPEAGNGAEADGAVRALRVAVQRSGRDGGEVLGITSTNSDEGVPALAARFADEIAARGVKIVRLSLLPEGGTRTDKQTVDLRPLLENPQLAMDLPITSDQPLLLGRLGPDGLMLSDPEQEAALHELLRILRSRADYIITELPPLTEFADAHVGARQMDDVALAVGWGRHPISQVVETLENLPELRTKLVGAIFTRVPRRSYSDYNSS